MSHRAISRAISTGEMQHPQPFKRRSRRLYAFFCALGLILALLGAQVPLQVGFAFDLPRNQALYVPMSDGTKIALDLWLPADLKPDARIPTVMRMTRYWRSFGLVDLPMESDPNYGDARRWNEAGYALVIVDGRGSGASFGTRPHPWSEREIEDYAEIVEWIARQPWSNGKVGSFGISYEGNATELLAARHPEPLKAIAVQFNNFDPYTQLAFPGGVFNEWFVRQWSDGNQVLDANDRSFICVIQKLTGESCEAAKAVVTGVKPVDEDADGELLKAAIAERRENLNVYEAAKDITYRDDPFGDRGDTLVDFSPYHFREEISKSGIPIFARASWFDAGTARGALSRFFTYDNPQTVTIGAWNHGGNFDSNPYNPPRHSVDPPFSEQLDELMAFFDAYLQDDAETTPPPSEIRYYTVGADEWKRSTVWPPEGVAMRSWYLAPDGGLSPEAPTGDRAADPYAVDFAATTGTDNRWHTQAGGKDVVYGDRADADRHLLTYTSPPLTEDVEITGDPAITLYLSSTATDGAFYAYLEDVDEGDRVTYLSEGQLRALHRQISSETPPYRIFGPYHSFEREAGMPLKPGEVTKVSFSLFPISVLLKKGHRLRVAIAGHDADTFARYPTSGHPTLTIRRDRRYASKIELPVRGF
ncbi:CocE/NonD family hydrolase [Oxynema sp. CENA135]|nr:CocE/NonD family hydrolase [Oxynema sp. CENA135]